jgi:PPE-repeat protein
MDFGFLPPEVNSWRIYTGPGSGPLLAAAGSWDSLAAELDITAESTESVLSALTSLRWRGPAAQAMAAAAAPYLAWLSATAEQTQQMAMQARSAAAAYESARAMTVPPAAVSANRIQLATLIATNFFGQNSAAIAATEAQYCEYWAQDAAAMNGYAASAAAATQLPTFSCPRPTTNDYGLAAQRGAAAANTSATNSAPIAFALSHTPAWTGDVTTLLDSASALPAQILPIPVLPNNFTDLDGILFVFAATSSTNAVAKTATLIIGAADNLGILPDLGAGAAGAAVAPELPTLAAAPLGPAAPSWTGAAGLGSVSAAFGHAGTVGSVSVPASWCAPSSPVTALPERDASGLPGAYEVSSPGSGMPGVPGLPGSTASRATHVVPRYGARLTVMARPPAAG